MEATRPAGDRRGAPGSVLRLDLPPPSSDAPDRAIPPPTQAGVGFGLWLGSPVWFCSNIGQREIKLRRHQGPTGGGMNYFSRSAKKNGEFPLCAMGFKADSKHHGTTGPRPLETKGARYANRKYPGSIPRAPIPKPKGSGQPTTTREKRQIHRYKGLTHRSCPREFSRSA